MENIELHVAIMAGVVLSLFLIVGEIAAMRKQVSKLRRRLHRHYQQGRLLRLSAEIGGIAAFLLIQPVLIGLLVLMALDNFNPGFSVHALQQLKHGLQSKKR